MKYLAKARMLSYNFMVDPVVYHLPPIQALVLAAMVARADNLGRLPGDPAVLLAYLFFPKPPRGDMTPDDVREALRACATAKPPIISWYRVEGASYVQFETWAEHQTIKPQNRKSSYPPPDSKGARAIASPTGEQGDIPGLEPVEQPNVQALVGNLVRGMGAMPDSDGFPAGEFADARFDVPFAHWLWKNGVRDPGLLKHIVEMDTTMAYTGSKYAYWAVGGKALEGVRLQFFGKAHEAEAADRRAHARDPVPEVRID